MANIAGIPIKEESHISDFKNFFDLFSSLQTATKLKTIENTGWVNKPSIDKIDLDLQNLSQLAQRTLEALTAEKKVQIFEIKNKLQDIQEITPESKKLISEFFAVLKPLTAHKPSIEQIIILSLLTKHLDEIQSIFHSINGLFKEPEPVPVTLKEMFSKYQKDHPNNSWAIGNDLRVEGLHIKCEDIERSNKIIAYFNDKKIGFKVIKNWSDFLTTINKWHDNLKTTILPDEKFPQFFFRILSQLCNEQKGKKKNLTGRIQIKEIYAVMKKELAPMKFPEYAFIYNLDFYQQENNRYPESHRFYLETGDETEDVKIGWKVNGLKFKGDYRTYSYVRCIGE